MQQRQLKFSIKSNIHNSKTITLYQTKHRKNTCLRVYHNNDEIVYIVLFYTCNQWFIFIQCTLRPNALPIVRTFIHLHHLRLHHHDLLLIHVVRSVIDAFSKFRQLMYVYYTCSARHTGKICTKKCMVILFTNAQFSLWVCLHSCFSFHIHGYY